MPSFNNQFMTERKDGDFLTRTVKPYVGEDVEKRVYVHGGNEFCYRVDELATLLIAQCPYTNCIGCHYHRNKSTRKRVDGSDKASSEIASEKKKERKDVLNGKSRSNAVSAEMRVFKRHGILAQRNRLVPCDKGADCDNMYCHYHDGAAERRLSEYLELDHPVDMLNKIDFDAPVSGCVLRAGPETKEAHPVGDTTQVNRHHAAGVPDPVVYSSIVSTIVDFIFEQTKNEGVNDLFDFFKLMRVVCPEMTVEIVEDAVSHYNIKLIEVERAAHKPPGLTKKSLKLEGLSTVLSGWVDIQGTYGEPVAVVKENIRRDVQQRIPEEVYQTAPGRKKKCNFKTRRNGVMRSAERQDIVSAWPAEAPVRPKNLAILRDPVLEIELIPSRYQGLENMLVDDEDEEDLKLMDILKDLAGSPRRLPTPPPVTVNMMNEMEIDADVAAMLDEAVGARVADAGQVDLSFIDPKRGPELSNQANFNRMRIAWATEAVTGVELREAITTLAAYLEQYTMIFNELENLKFEDMLELCGRIEMWARDGAILLPVAPGHYPMDRLAARVLFEMYTRQDVPAHFLSRYAFERMQMRTYAELHQLSIMIGAQQYNPHVVAPTTVPMEANPVPGVFRAPRIENLVPARVNPVQGVDEQPPKRRRVVDLDASSDDESMVGRVPMLVRPPLVVDWLEQNRIARLVGPEADLDDIDADNVSVVSRASADSISTIDLNDEEIHSIIEEAMLDPFAGVLIPLVGGSVISSLTHGSSLVSTSLVSSSTGTRSGGASCRLPTPVDVKVPDPADARKRITEVVHYYWGRIGDDFYASGVYGAWGDYVDELKTVEVAMTCDKPVLTEGTLEHFARGLYDWLFIKDRVGALDHLEGQVVQQIQEARFQEALSATTLGWLFGIRDGDMRSHAVRVDLLNSAYSIKKDVKIFKGLAHKWHVEFLSKVSSTPNRNVNATPATWIMSEIMSSVRGDRFTPEERAVYTSIENIVTLLDTVNYVINEIVIKTNQLANMMPHRGTKLVTAGTRVHALATGDWAFGADFR